MSNIFTPADAILAHRCQRQWVDQCLGRDETGKLIRFPALPREINGEANLRETARVITAGVERFREHAIDVYRSTVGDSQWRRHPAVGYFPVAAVESALVSDWHAQTMDAISDAKPIVSGVLVAGAGAVLFDYARFHQKIGAWEVALYRPATGVRGVYYTEAAHLRRAFDRLQIPIGGLHLVYLNKSYVFDDERYSERLFLESNLLKRAGKSIEGVEKQLAHLRALVEANGEVDREYRCRSRSCTLCRQGYTGNEQKGDRVYHVKTLHKGGEIARGLIEEGITDLRDDALSLEKMTRKQRIQVEAVRRGEPHVDAQKLSRFMKKLVYPLFYLDFEAFAPAIPPFPGLRPYEHTPVVVSVHVATQPEEKPEPKLFVSTPGRDQRGEMFRWIEELLGEAGSIVVFSKSFESAMVRQLARHVGQSGDSLVQRMVDLLEPFSEFWVYHPHQEGKVSLKRVLPVYTGDRGYDTETVQDGMHANLGYIRLSDQASNERDAAAAEGVSDLIGEVFPQSPTPVPTPDQIGRYCAVDTIAMYYLVKKLTTLARGHPW